MRPFAPVLTAMLLLMFVDLILLFSYLRTPYFVMLGIFFLWDTNALLVTVCLILVDLMLIFLLLKRHGYAYRGTKWFACALALNSMVNVIAAFVVTTDINNFLFSLFGSGVLIGFITFHAFLALLNLIILSLLRNVRLYLRFS